MDNLLVVLGFFVVFPLISIRFVEQLGWAGIVVGFALGLRQLVQQGLGIFGGAIGYTGGGWLYDLGKEMQLPELPWFLLGTIGLITLIALYRQFNPKKISPAVLN